MDKDRRCFFTTSIADTLECSSDGDFDFNGFPRKRCSKYPCERFREAQARVQELERERGAQSGINPARKNGVLKKRGLRP